MKRLLVLTLLAVAAACSLNAQAVDVSVCDVVKNPKPFNGKIVRIKGVVFAGFDSFIIKDSSACGFPVDGIWLDYPQGAKGRAGAVALVRIQPASNYTGPYKAPARTPVTLDKNKDFKKFDSLLAEPHRKGSSICLGCTANQVTATLVGRLDTVDDATLKYSPDGKVISFGGFGNMNLYPARLVLQSVSDITAQPLNYTSADSRAPEENGPPRASSEFFDPMGTAQKIVERLAATPSGAAAKRAIEAFDKNSGTVLNRGIDNEEKSENPGKTSAPSGVLYNCTLNAGLLRNAAYVYALYHMGNHIATMRGLAGSTKAAAPFVLEYNAWMLAISSGVVSGEKYLAMPGGYLGWDSSWSNASRESKMDAGVSKYLSKVAALNR